MEQFQPRSQLPYTWSAFFARHGSLTSVQQQAIPLILAGHNTLVIAPTASGKTEAVIAPLLERHVLGGDAPAGSEPALRILYICPTRALVRDLYERLAPPLAQLQVTLGMKSGDTGPVSASRPPTVLVTTPESTNSLLTREPRLLAGLQAVVLDEIHLFDRSVRGDHLRCLLRRIEHVRRYSQGQAGDRSTHPACSASPSRPPSLIRRGVASRYLAEDGAADAPHIVEAGGGRAIEADVQPMHGLADLATALALRAGGGLGIRKTLVFCNSRNEVEQTAAYLRQHLPFEAAVFVHYSNLDPAERRAVEDGFAHASVAVCVASSTLELGIDIGSIDDVALVGPPPTLTSFLQRIGRGGRRSGLTRVLCLPRSALEDIRFAALLALAQSAPRFPLSPPPLPTFRPSVLVQQIFSLLKQSPTGGVRLADLRRIAPAEVGDVALRQILDHLTALDFLRRGGIGEWRPAQRLHDLADAHEIYSNIGTDPLALQVVDAFSGRVLAQTGQMRWVGETFLLGGRLLEVVWRDRYRLGVRPAAGQPAEETLRFVDCALRRAAGRQPGRGCVPGAGAGPDGASA